MALLAQLWAHGVMVAYTHAGVTLAYAGLHWPTLVFTGLHWPTLAYTGLLS